MEAIVNSIIALSDSASDLASLLNQLKASDAALQSNYGQLSAALQSLDPARHSLGIVFIL